jgi:tol-pal system protein YbgF
MVMKLVRSIVLTGCAVFLLSSCASQDEIRKLNYQLRTVNQKIDDVRTNTVNKIQKRQASSVNKIDAVSSETEQLRALIEESEHKSAMLREANTQDLAALQGVVAQLRTDNEQRLQALESKIDQLAASLERVQSARVRAAEQRAKEAARRAEEARKRTMAAATASTKSFVVVQPSGQKIRISKGRVVKDPINSGGQAPAEAPVKSSSPKPQNTVAEKSPEPAAANESTPFGQGMARFNAGKYKKAYKNFEQVLSGNPQGKKAAQTLFYMGECLYNQGEFDLAILDYQKVISNHAGDSHTPAALLKQGMAFEKLTDLETAKIIFKKLVVEYPDSSEAGLAQKRLANL